VLVAATLQGAFFALVKAAVDRAAAEGTRKLTASGRARTIPAIKKRRRNCPLPVGRVSADGTSGK
jgi:hypothetical protein